MDPEGESLIQAFQLLYTIILIFKLKARILRTLTAHIIDYTILVRVSTKAFAHRLVLLFAHIASLLMGVEMLYAQNTGTVPR